MRVALISQVTPVVVGYTQLLQALGHEPVGVVSVRSGNRYGSLGELVTEAPPELDVVVPPRRERLAPLLRALDPDLALCLGFPWKLTPEMLSVPPLGVVNTHPSLLPRYRGPNPVAWAIRNGDTEIGMTFHRMDPGLDTGAILAQEAIPLDDEHSWEELQPKFVEAVGRLLPVALERVAAATPATRRTSRSLPTSRSSRPSTSRSTGAAARGGRAPGACVAVRRQGRRRAGRADRARRRAGARAARLAGARRRA